jgi:hypothetical protein
VIASCHKFMCERPQLMSLSNNIPASSGDRGDDMPKPVCAQLTHRNRTPSSTVLEIVAAFENMDPVT